MLIVKHQTCTPPEICLGKQYVYTATADFTHKAHYTLGQVKEKRKQATTDEHFTLAPLVTRARFFV
jgi:hypothetical protein